MRLLIAAFVSGALLAASLASAVARQNLPVPQASPSASVEQTVGITDINVTYHRPGVKGRTIWGGLVPYGQVWRAGANENTTVAFSGPVRFCGTPLAAGTYGLHMIPAQGEWIVILSTNATSWGSFFYSKSEDALRVNIRPRSAEHQEWLSYQFRDLTPSSVVLTLRWAELEVPMPIEVDVPASVIKNAREVYLRGLAGFSWQGWYQAAQYCAINHTNLEEAIGWADRSIGINRNFRNLWVKGVLLERMGKGDEGKETKQQAAAMADEATVNALGYQFLGGGDLDGAHELFALNVEKYPQSWNVWDSLAESYAAQGKTTEAISNYTKALSMVKDETQKDRIRQILKTLGAK